MNLEAILKRIGEIRNLLESDDEIKDMDALEKELRGLTADKAAIEQRQALLAEADAINNNTAPETRSTGMFNSDQEHNDANEAETREISDGEALQEKRAITVASDDLVIPEHTANDVRGTFNQISSLLDGVRKVPLSGGESYKRGYEISHGEGSETGEGKDYHETEVKFGYAAITKSKVTAYSEETEEVAKLAPAAYSQIIKAGTGKALRRRLTRQILIGSGEDNQLTGIFTDKATAIDPTTDITLSTIDAETLDSIIYSFGGEEDVESPSTLVLNKLDLKAFATLRNDRGDKIYDVKAKGNTGTIDGVNFIINSACKPLATATDGDYVMAYGPLSNYELAVFSPVEIMQSTDFKFKQGMIAHRGSIFAGGNVAAHNGFLRVKKG